MNASMLSRFSHVRLCATPWTAALQAPLSTEFSRQAYWSGLPFPSPHGTTDCFQIGKGIRQDFILSPCSFNLYAEYIMRNAGLDEAQAGIKISRRNINHLRYEDETIPMAEREQLKEPLDESERGTLKLA